MLLGLMVRLGNSEVHVDSFLRICYSSADLLLSVLQLLLQDGHFLGMAEFLLIDGVELRAKQLGLRLQREQRLLQLLHLMETKITLS